MTKKKKVTLTQLVVVANEFNSFMFEKESQHINMELSRDDLKEEIEVMAADLEDTDTITEATAEILDQLNLEYPCKVDAVEEVEEEVDETEPDETEEEETEEEEETGETVDTSKMKEKELLELAKENGIRVPPPYRGKGKTGKAKTTALAKLRTYVAEKMAAGPTKTPKKDKKKSGKVSTKKTSTVMKRGVAVAKAIRTLCKKGATMKEIMAHSDELVVESDGKSNPSATNVNKYTIDGLVEFNVLTVNDKGVYKLTK